MNSLSICLTTNRSLESSQASLLSGIGYIETVKNIELILADNSDDSLKRTWCKKYLSKNVKYVSSSGTNAMQNFDNALSVSEGKYVLNLHDDDFILKVSKEEVDLKSDNKMIGISPSKVIWEAEKGIIKVFNYGIVGETAKARISQYFALNQGFNSGIYSFLQKDIIIDVSQLCAKYHPTHAGYYDWAFMLAWASSGNIIHDPSTIYTYNNHNWSGDSQRIQLQIEKQFTGCGLQSRSQLFLPLLTGLDSFILICRETSPVARDEIYEAGIEALVMYLKSFLARYGQNKTLFTPNEQKAINEMAVAVGIKNILNAALKVIDAHAPQIVEKYKLFYKVSIGCEWGDFR